MVGGGPLTCGSSFIASPLHRVLEVELARFRQSDRGGQNCCGEAPSFLKGFLRELDVTDAALCLRDAPDNRWRRFVTANRETEIREELAFCQAWEARGELTVERQLDAWRSLDEKVRNLEEKS